MRNNTGGSIGRRNKRSRKQFFRQRPTSACNVCGIPLDRGKLVVDHIKPLSQGGSNHITNMQALCRPCHKRKSAAELTSKRGNVDPLTGFRGAPQHQP